MVNGQSHKFQPATRVWSKRIPAATKISAFSYRTAHGKSVKPDRQEHNTVTGNEDTDQNPDLAQNGSNSDNQGTQELSQKYMGKFS